MFSRNWSIPRRRIYKVQTAVTSHARVCRHTSAINRVRLDYYEFLLLPFYFGYKCVNLYCWCRLSRNEVSVLSYSYYDATFPQVWTRDIMYSVIRWILVFTQLQIPCLSDRRSLPLSIWSWCRTDRILEPQYGLLYMMRRLYYTACSVVAYYWYRIVYLT